jgi:hypothetical protein
MSRCSEPTGIPAGSVRWVCSTSLGGRCILSDFISAAKLEELQQLLLRRLGGQGKNLSVVVRERSVVLQGIVRSYHLKQCAQHLVLQMFDGFVVVNAIEVRGT